MKLSNIFNNIPADLSDEAFEKIAGSEHVAIERIVSKGHRSPETGWYVQERDEWVILLQGNAEIMFATGETLKLTAGDHVNIPAHAKHKVSWTDPDTESIWLAVHYPASA
jgi:cupin 2 domain-containing protein